MIVYNNIIVGGTGSTLTDSFAITPEGKNSTYTTANSVVIDEQEPEYFVPKHFTYIDGVIGYTEAGLAAFKKRRQEEVSRLKDWKLREGFSFNGNVFDIDAGSIASITAVATGLALGTGFPGGASTIGWWDKNNVTHTFDEAAFTQFAAAAKDYVAFLHATGRGHKDAIELLTDADSVRAYNITAGW